MNRSLILLATALCFSVSGAVFSENLPTDWMDSHWQGSPFQRLSHQRPSNRSQIVTTSTLTASKEESSVEPRVRVHQEGILQISGRTVTPARISVKAGPAAIVGSLEIAVRTETNSRWFFRAENIDPETNIWDEKGRALLVPGKVTCQVLHRASLNNYEQAGLTLAVDSPVFSFSNGVNQEKMRSDFFEGEDICPIGDVPAFTTQRDIEQKCKTCLGRVLKTIKEDVNARLATLYYRVDAPICSQDSECYREDSDWTRGRCVLVQDKNGSHFSECRARSSVGGACRGKGSRGLFEYACDTGLACVKTHSASSFLDYNQYECRDPKNWKFKGPLKIKPIHASF